MEVYRLNKVLINVGDRFGHLEVLKLHNENHRGMSWLCKCDCGNQIILGTTRLLGTENRRPNRSCGCAAYSHNGLLGKNKKLYDVWFQMTSRCHNQNNVGYGRYGGKGITVCNEWRNSFENFYEWSMKNGYKDGMTIDRIDVNGDYTPNNCRWTDWFIQGQNKGLRKNNKTGITGIMKYDYGYRVQLVRKGVRKFLGNFKSIEDAKSAWEKAEEHYKKCGTIEDL